MTNVSNDVATNSSDRTPSEALVLATATAQAMWQRDRTAQSLAMRIVHIAPGQATLRMPVRSDMVNGHHICHGGMIFTLADTAFAYACNSYNQTAVASACQVDFIAPAKEGEELEAEATERSASGRTGVYDVTVRTTEGKLIALFRGKSHRIGGDVINGPDNA